MDLPGPVARPAAHRRLDTDALSFDAVQLFIDRARQHQPGFTGRCRPPCPSYWSLCRRLDGIPLAIELAAVRLRSMALPDILRHLGDRFQLLTGGSRTALARQQTLRATVDWSYDLLTDDEALVLRRLSVFAGGFTVEAAEAVCVSDDHRQLRLLEHPGLAVRQEPGPSRHRRGHPLSPQRDHPPVRRRAAGRGRRRARCSTHAKPMPPFYLELAERVAPHLTGGDQKAWLDLLEIERENLRVTIGLFLESDSRHHEDALRMCVALRRFWFARGYWNEASEFVTAALQLSEIDSRLPAWQAARTGHRRTDVDPTLHACDGRSCCTAKVLNWVEPWAMTK